MKKSNFQKNPDQVLKLWERLELRYNQGDDQADFVTRVEDLSKSILIVEKPVRISGRLELMAGNRVEVAFNRDDASYIFNAVVISIDADREGIITLQPVSDLSRSQRRRFVRLDIAGEVTLKNIDLIDDKEAGLSLDFKGELLNISAGGILICTEGKLKKDGLVLLNFQLKDSQRLENILGLVKRWEESKCVPESGSEFLAGIEFLTKVTAKEKISSGQLNCLPSNVNYFDEALQQAIVQFVYRQQVENRKKMKVNA